MINLRKYFDHQDDLGEGMLGQADAVDMLLQLKLAAVNAATPAQEGFVAMLETMLYAFHIFTRFTRTVFAPIYEFQVSADGLMFGGYCIE